MGDACFSTNSEKGQISFFFAVKMNQERSGCKKKNRKNQMKWSTVANQSQPLLCTETLGSGWLWLATVGAVAGFSLEVGLFVFF